jgi:ubiquinone/menaquinone biosynthesis C-methylase UbiE
MAVRCPIGFDTEYLRDRVYETYDRVARDPGGEFHFHHGLDYACEYLKYDRAELDALPLVSTARFAGVANPHRIGRIEKGQTVLDHACGAGMDLLIAAKRVGTSGKAIGVDMTEAMRDCAREGAMKAGLSGIVDIIEGVYEELPVEDGTVDVVISNGVINLAPDKMVVFREIHRVLKPGGKLFLGDVVVQRELKLDARSNPDLWAACIAGALTERELPGVARAAGFSDCVITERFDCFRNTSAGVKVSKDLYVQGVNFFARKS